MAHDKDHDHVAVPRQARPDSNKRREHPTPVPREPVDPRAHPRR